MTNSKSVVTVQMARPHLRRLPDRELPEGFSVRWYDTGDDATWVRIHRQSGGYPDFDGQEFLRSFGGYTEELARRLCFIRDPDGRDIATATAWFGDEDPGREWGRIHWVAMVENMHGKGLAKPLMGIVLHRLSHLEHRRAYLVTQSFRIPAIRLYLSCGFMPRVLGDEDRREWDRLRASGMPIPPAAE